MLFQEIPGQELIKERLRKTVSDGRISHAQLFYGPEGSGNLALALAYARYIFCNDRNDKDACGQCVSCVKMNKYIHPDLHFVFPSVAAKKDEESNENPASLNFYEKWRTALLENPYLNQYQWYEKIEIENKQGIISSKESSEILRKLSLKSYESDYKILILWLPERMHPGAANRLLKIIEEPPPYTLFLFVTENSGDILPTVLSRTQIIKIPSLKDEDIRKALLDKFNIPADKAEDIVRLADGNYNKALASLEEDDSNKECFDRFVNLTRSSFSKNLDGIIRWVEDISAYGRERQKLFLIYAMRMFRENYLLTLDQSDSTHMTSYENDFSIRFSKFVHDQNINHLNDELNNAYNHISANAYPRIVFLDMCLKFGKLLNQ